MRRFVWFLIVAFSASILVLGCGKSEEPKPKQSAEQAAPAPKEGLVKKEAEKKESVEAAKPSERKPTDTQAGEAKPAAEKPGDEKK
jgi:preprotein translocase subunit SecG